MIMQPEKLLVSICKHTIFSDKKNLLVVGEYSKENLTSLTKTLCISHCITNRFDVAQHGKELKIETTFNDFVFSEIEKNAPYDHIVIPISKEKLVTHHTINAAYNLLKKNGKLILLGKKNQGIKSYFDNCRKQLKYEGTLKKEKDDYFGILSPYNAPPCTPLNDEDYSNLRPTVEIGNQTLSSKPGVFGWNKIDTGSEILVEQLNQYFTKNKTIPPSALDLGCGYGHLCLALHNLGVEEIIATDNNASAIAACHTNLANLRDGKSSTQKFQVIASNCAMDIKEKVDLIVCNPPFHQGFSVEGELTDLFLKQSKQHLNHSGSAFFVVNSFIPLEKKASIYFSKVDTLINTGQFKVLQLCV